MPRAKILMVEDSEELLMVWVTLFKTCTEFQLKAVSKGRTAMELLDSGYQPDLLVTDYYLGDCNGLEVIERATKAVPNLPVIVITGNNEDKTLEQKAAAGAFDLLIKPVKFNLLKQMVQQKICRT